VKLKRQSGTVVEESKLLRSEDLDTIAHASSGCQLDSLIHCYVMYSACGYVMLWMAEGDDLRYLAASCSTPAADISISNGTRQPS
jgi:hypothetical protein